MLFVLKDYLLAKKGFGDEFGDLIRPYSDEYHKFLRKMRDVYGMKVVSLDLPTRQDFIKKINMLAVNSKPTSQFDLERKRRFGLTTAEKQAFAAELNQNPKIVFDPKTAKRVYVCDDCKHQIKGHTTPSPIMKRDVPEKIVIKVGKTGQAVFYKFKYLCSSQKQWGVCKSNKKCDCRQKYGFDKIINPYTATLSYYTKQADDAYSEDHE